MTTNQTEETRELVGTAIAPAESRLEAWIHDPFASMFMGTAVVAVAVAFILSGMGLVSFFLG